MQTATCSIRLSKSDTALTNIIRENVTPAEAAIFRHQKGQDAVTIVGDVREIRRNIAEEKERLLLAHRKAYLECFPGTSNVLPSRFEDIGLEYGEAPTDVIAPDEPDEPEAEAEPAKKKAKTKGKKPAAEENEDDEIGLAPEVN